MAAVKRVWLIPLPRGYLRGANKCHHTIHLFGRIAQQKKKKKWKRREIIDQHNHSNCNRSIPQRKSAVGMHFHVSVCNLIIIDVILLLLLYSSLKWPRAVTTNFCIVRIKVQFKGYISSLGYNFIALW